MKKVYLILAAAVGMTITSCTTNDYLGDVNNDQAINDGSIQFGLKFQNLTRADIAGQAAATKLGNNFYVTGTKGSEETNSPSTTVVFDNYLVHYGINTAGTTESNTANWEYVGIDQGTPKTPEDYNRVKLSSIAGAQTIKYWDYSAAQYDFLGFSTGTFKAVKDKDFGTLEDDEINVTAMATGATLSTNAYTFKLPNTTALENTYITDITTVTKGDAYGKEVTLQFKNLGSKVRMALYETVPGYSVKDVVFYTIDGTNVFTDGNKNGTARLISAETNGLPKAGTIQVYFPSIGTDSKSPKKQDYNKASATITAVTPYAAANYVKAPEFGELTAQLKTKERDEIMTNVAIPEFIGRSLLEATFAGDANADYYQTVFPVSTSAPLTLRVDYTLVPIDGAAETITVKGAKAVVPSTYTKWLPNYAYTYIFKISDNTNGWTGTGSEASGLFPITFDAVVTEATDFNAEQRTVTTVATPSITTYQQYHADGTDEYTYTVQDLDGNNVNRNVYVQVMDNRTATAELKGDLNGTTPTDDTKRSLLYAVDGTKISEATVMDALENQASVDGSGAITGRNNITLTPKKDNINAGVTSIVNGIDNKPITVTAGQAAQISLESLSAGNYAYVYDYSTAAKQTTIIYQPISFSGTMANGVKYITTDILAGITYASNKTSEGDSVDEDYMYFSKTTDGSATTTYSFVSVDGKTTLPGGLLKVKIDTYLKTSDGDDVADANTFVFNTYTRNDGKYAVKVIKVQ